MSNRVKARLTVAVVLLGVIVWRLGAQQVAENRRFPFPALLLEQVIEQQSPPITNCEAAVREVHSEPLRAAALPGAAVLDEEEAARLVQSVAVAYFQRDFQTDARLSAPLLLEGVFYGQERLAWGQLWQPAGFDGVYTEMEAVVVYVDAVVAVPLALYTGLEVQPGAVGCLAPAPPPTARNWLTWVLPPVMLMAAGLVVVGVFVEWQARHAP